MGSNRISKTPPGWTRQSRLLVLLAADRYEAAQATIEALTDRLISALDARDEALETLLRAGDIAAAIELRVHTAELEERRRMGLECDTPAMRQATEPDAASEGISCASWRQ